jgi:hypothetical protein
MPTCLGRGHVGEKNLDPRQDSCPVRWIPFVIEMNAVREARSGRTQFL